MNVTTKCQSILLAEDNDEIRETLVEILELEGYRVETATNGREALDRLAQREPPVLVLLDLMMPKMSGWEFLDAHREGHLGRHPVVVISALPATESVEDPTPLDTAEALTKPIELNRFLETVERYCERQRTA